MVEKAAELGNVKTQHDLRADDSIAAGIYEYAGTLQNAILVDNAWVY